MGRKSEWPKGTELQKTSLEMPRRLLDAARIRAMEQECTLQELVAEALEDYLRKAKKGASSGR